MRMSTSVFSMFCPVIVRVRHVARDGESLLFIASVKVSRILVDEDEGPLVHGCRISVFDSAARYRRPSLSYYTLNNLASPSRAEEFEMLNKLCSAFDARARVLVSSQHRFIASSGSHRNDWRSPRTACSQASKRSWLFLGHATS